MKLTEGQRLKRWLDYKGISQVKFGENLGKSKGQINNWCGGAAPIPDKIKIKVIEIFPDLNARWFLTGEGDMLEDATPDNEVNEKPEKYGTNCCNLCEEKDKVIRALEGQLKDKEELLQVYRGKRGNDIANSA